jgi:hypothetical protein
MRSQHEHEARLFILSVLLHYAQHAASVVLPGGYVYQWPYPQTTTSSASSASYTISGQGVQNGVYDVYSSSTSGGSNGVLGAFLAYTTAGPTTTMFSTPANKYDADGYTSVLLRHWSMECTLRGNILVLTCPFLWTLKHLCTRIIQDTPVLRPSL